VEVNRFCSGRFRGRITYYTGGGHMTKGEDRKRAALKEGLSIQEFYLGKYEEAVGERVRTLAGEQFVERLDRKSVV
jgi:hypothetical protein